MTPGTLSSRELCDVLNYVLGLPEKLGKRTILRPVISPCVVTSWPTKTTRSPVEGWCDARLRECGLGPRMVNPSRSGPRTGPRQVPHEILAWAPAAWRKAEA
jgi:hypothetical protein